MGISLSGNSPSTVLSLQDNPSHSTNYKLSYTTKIISSLVFSGIQALIAFDQRIWGGPESAVDPSPAIHNLVGTSLVSQWTRDTLEASESG
jgi:hypothetical protein